MRRLSIICCLSIRCWVPWFDRLPFAEKQAWPLSDTFPNPEVTASTCQNRSLPTHKQYRSSRSWWTLPQAWASNKISSIPCDLKACRSILRDSFSGVMKYFKTLVGLFLVSEALVGRNYRRAVYCCFLDMLLKWLLPEEASEKLFECMQMYLSLALHAVCGLVLYSLSLEANAAP